MKIYTIQGLLLLTVVIEIIFNWNVDNPSLLFLSFTNLGLYYSLEVLRRKTQQ